MDFIDFNALMFLLGASIFFFIGKMCYTNRLKVQAYAYGAIGVLLLGHGLFCAVMAATSYQNGDTDWGIFSTYEWMETSTQTIKSSTRDDVKREVTDYIMGCIITAQHGPESLIFLSELKTYGYPGSTCEEALKEFDQE